MKHCVFSASVALYLLAAVGCATPEQDRAKMKKEIKREVLMELALLKAVQEAVQPAPQLERERLKKEIEQELWAKLQKQNKPLIQEESKQNTRENQPSSPAFGRAEGQILRKGKGLAKCRVKLIRLVKSDRLVDLFSAYQEGVEFETITNQNGKYEFEKIPVGDYKIKWQLPDDKGWIRRLKDKPDVTIKEEQVGHLKPIETYKKLVPR